MKLSGCRLLLLLMFVQLLGAARAKPETNFAGGKIRSVVLVEAPAQPGQRSSREADPQGYNSQVPSSPLQHGLPAATPSTVPSQTYGTPLNAPAPSQTYGTPLNAPAPSQTYGAPHNAPAPSQTYGTPNQNNFGNTISAILNELTEGAVNTITGGLPQIPAGSIVNFYTAIDPLQSSANSHAPHNPVFVQPQKETHAFVAIAPENIEGQQVLSTGVHPTPSSLQIEPPSSLYGTPVSNEPAPPSTLYGTPVSNEPGPSFAIREEGSSFDGGHTSGENSGLGSFPVSSGEVSGPQAFSGEAEVNTQTFTSPGPSISAIPAAAPAPTAFAATGSGFDTAGPASGGFISTAPTGGVANAIPAGVGFTPTGSATVGFAPASTATAGFAPAGTATVGFAPAGHTTFGFAPAGHTTFGFAPAGTASAGFAPAVPATAGFAPAIPAPAVPATAGFAPAIPAPTVPATAEFPPAVPATSGFAPAVPETSGFAPALPAPAVPATAGFAPALPPTAGFASAVPATAGFAPALPATAGFGPAVSAGFDSGVLASTGVGPAVSAAASSGFGPPIPHTTGIGLPAPGTAEIVPAVPTASPAANDGFPPVGTVTPIPVTTLNIVASSAPQVVQNVLGPNQPSAFVAPQSIATPDVAVPGIIPSPDLTFRGEVGLGNALEAPASNLVHSAPSDFSTPEQFPTSVGGAGFGAPAFGVPLPPVATGVTASPNPLIGSPAAFTASPAAFTTSPGPFESTQFFNPAGFGDGSNALNQPGSSGSSLNLGSALAAGTGNFVGTGPGNFDSGFGPGGSGSGSFDPGLLSPGGSNAIHSPTGFGNQIAGVSLFDTASQGTFAGSTVPNPTTSSPLIGSGGFNNLVKRDIPGRVQPKESQEN